MSDVSDDAKHRLTLRGFTTEDAQELAHNQVQRVIILTNNFVVTVITVITSAFGLVTALAWNTYISNWLPTVEPFGITDIHGKQLSYAITVTFITVLALTIAGVVNRRHDKRQEREQEAAEYAPPTHTPPQTNR